MIKSAIGQGRLNKPCDVIIVQLLLNKIISNNLLSLKKLKLNGLNSKDLENAIKEYQKAKKMKFIDGWIGPRGGTIQSLLKDAKLAGTGNRMAFIRRNFNTKFAKPVLNSVRIPEVTSLYEKQYRVLNSVNKKGFQDLLATAKNDKGIMSLPEFSYMLATTKHETASTFRAIEEYGKGSGRLYGKEISVVDPGSKKVFKNKYYGRGYVQLTWGYNYQRLDHHLGYGSYPNRFKTTAKGFNQGFSIKSPTKSVYLNPSRVLKSDVAYKCMVWGMQGGHFTGVSTSRYIKSNSVDYYNARKIINGLDVASKIASYAEDFEILLLTASN